MVSSHEGNHSQGRNLSAVLTVNTSMERSVVVGCLLFLVGWSLDGRSQTPESVAALYAQGEYARVVEEVQAPKTAELAQLRADALHKLGMLTEALAAYNNAIQLEPSNGEAYLNRGICALSLNDFSMAAADLSEARRILPSNPKTWYWSAALAYANNANDACLDHLAEAVRLDPNYLEAHYLGGALFYDTGALKEAEKAFLRCLSIDPNHALSQLALSMVYIDQLRYNKANELLEGLGESDDEGIRRMAIYQRGVSKYESRDRAGACEDWEEAARLGDADAQVLIDSACAEARKKKLARRSVHVEF